MNDTAGGRRVTGIDDLNIDGGTLAIGSAELAEARGLGPRDLSVAGFERRSILPPYEDAVTIGVNAALPLVEAAGRDAFDLLIVATESGLDWGKPLSAYVHRYLGLAPRCRNVELKHACYAGTAAIQLATAWVRGGERDGARALVVMTDVARRHLGDPAELTAGTGAVAVTIANDPSMLAIEARGGCSCREVYDVARPTATGEWADAVLSLAAYLDLIEEAWAEYRRLTGTTAAIDSCFRYLLFHTPLLSLIRDAHRLLLESERGSVAPEEAAASFDRMVTPALGFARELANLYSGSVYCLLGALLDDPAHAAGTRVGICSYGSGSCAEIYSGQIVESAHERIRRHAIGERLAGRTAVRVPQYERLVRETETVLTAREYVPSRDFVPGHFERCYASRRRLVLSRIENHHRLYAWSDERRAPW